MKKVFSLLLAVLMLATAMVTGFASDESNVLVIEEAGAALTPGKTYTFEVTMQDASGADKPLDAETVGSNRFFVSATEGRTALESAKVQQKDGKYLLSVTLRAGYSAAQQKLALTVALGASASAKPAAKGSVSYPVGYDRVSEETADSMAKGDSLQVGNDAPVLTGTLMDKVAALNGYKPVTVAGAGWQLSANLYGLSAQNLYTTQDGVKEVLNAYEEGEFKFLNFAGAPKFASKTAVSIDVSDIETDFDGSYHLYRWLGGKLYKINSSYDQAAAQLRFHVSSELGSYVIADRALTGSLLVSGSGSSSSGSSSGSGSSGSGSSSGAEDANPDTGANDIVGIASALALAAALSGAALSLRKK